MIDGYWITESTTWKIHAESEAEARAIWLTYFDEGVEWAELPMKPKESGVDADWDWRGE